MRSTYISFLISTLIKIVILLKIVWICSFLFILFDYFYNFKFKDKGMIYRTDVFLIYMIKISLAFLILLFLTKEGLFYMKTNKLAQSILCVISFILILDAIVSHPYNEIFEKKFQNYNLEDLT
jgi:hypothetical protein